MKTLAILGAGGHGRVVADAAEQAGWASIVFFDDVWPKIKRSGSWEIVGKIADLEPNLANYAGVVVAIGANTVRMKLLDQLQAQGAAIPTIIHPNAIVSSYASIECGTVVFAGAVINIGAQLGRGCIVNTAATVDHDCLLGAGVHISPGAHLGGTVAVGNLTWVGLGASIRNQITIGKSVVVGAGAVVVSNVPDNFTVVGNPARQLNQKRN